MAEDAPGGFVRASVPAGTIIENLSAVALLFGSARHPGGRRDTAQIVAFLAERYLIQINPAEENF